MGTPGKMGPKGSEGPKGEQGTQAPQRNWKQCAWKDLNDGRDNGLIKVKDLINNNYKNISRLLVSLVFMTRKSE